MENKQVKTEADLNITSVNTLIDIPLLYDYPESKSQMNMGGSPQVLADFFEFTDYLIPHNRVIPMRRCTRQSQEDDHYSELLSI